MTIDRNGQALSSWNGVSALSAINGVETASLPLDDVSAVLAFSTARKLRTAYTGDAIRVRESGGDTEADIGFSGNALDESALTTHTGANNGLIATGYGQGAANNFTQTTASLQPLIVSSGTVNKIGTKPAALFDGSNSFLESASGLVDCTSGLCAAAVVRSDGAGGSTRGILASRPGNGPNFRFQFSITSAGALRMRIYDNNFPDYIGRMSNAGEIADSTNYVVHFTYDGGTSASGIKIYVNDVQVDTTDDNGGTFTGPGGTAGSLPVQVGAIDTNFVWNGEIAEAIVVLDSDIGSIPANMMEFYGIS